MTKTAAFIFLLLSFSGYAMAQRSYGYWTFSQGAVTSGGRSDYQLGLNGGGEIGIRKGFSAGLEGGFTGQPQHYGDSMVGIVSFNGYYHPQHSKTARLDPFVTMGYSIMFRSDKFDMFNYGAGLNWWAKSGMALRAEVRDHTFSNPGRIHLWQLRVGVSFTRLWP